jgi:Type IIB DNA topoisomerase
MIQEQGNSDAVLDDVACMLGCTRSSLHGELMGLADTRRRRTAASNRDSRRAPASDAGLRLALLTSCPVSAQQWHYRGASRRNGCIIIETHHLGCTALRFT